MRKMLATLILAVGEVATAALAMLFAIALAASLPAAAQTIPTPQTWPKNKVTEPVRGTYRLCVLNTGTYTDTRNIPYMFANQLMIDAVREDLALLGTVVEADLTNVYTGRFYMKGPNEGDYWVTLLFGEYMCRSFAAGTPVSIYAQIERSGWREICLHGVAMNMDITMMMAGNWFESTCKFSPGARVTH
jgi:hypothetical protein